MVPGKRKTEEPWAESFRSVAVSRDTLAFDLYRVFMRAFAQLRTTG